MSDSTGHPYRKHLKPHTYIMQFGETFTTFDLNYLKEFIHHSLQEKAEISFLKYVETKAHSQAKLVYVNLRRFSIWVAADDKYRALNTIEAADHLQSETLWNEAFKEYTINTIGVGRYVGRDLSACWRGLENFRDNGLPLPKLQTPESHARRQSNAKSLSLRICSDNLKETREEITNLASLIHSVSDAALQNAINTISSRPELRNYCEISRLIQQIERSAKANLQ